MAILMRDQESRSELQQKLAAELREKIARQSERAGKPDMPDGVKDSAYVKDFEKKFNPNGRIIAILVICLSVAAVFGLALLLT